MTLTQRKIVMPLDVVRVNRALATIDAYPEDQPPTSSSDREAFHEAARILAVAVKTLRDEVVTAENEVTSAADEAYWKGHDNGWIDCLEAHS